MQTFAHCRVLAACLLLSLVGALPAHAALVENGGFEFDDLTTGNETLTLRTIPTGWSSLADGQNVDLLGNGFFGSTAAEGVKFLDLIGNSTGSFPSGVRQSLALQGGVVYRLSFNFNGGAPLTVTDPLLNWALGDLDSGSIEVGALNVFSDNGRPVTAWGFFTRDILATASGNHWLSFSTPYGDSGGPYLDNVSLHAVVGVPEPGTGTLLLAGLGLVGLAARRRHQR